MILVWLVNLWVSCMVFIVVLVLEFISCICLMGVIWLMILLVSWVLVGVGVLKDRLWVVVLVIVLMMVGCV